MDCGQALALAAAALVMAGEPLTEPLARAQSVAVEIITETEDAAFAAAHEARARCSAALARMNPAQRNAIRIVHARSGARHSVPDARIHGAVRRPI